MGPSFPGLTAGALSAALGHPVASYRLDNARELEQVCKGSGLQPSEPHVEGGPPEGGIVALYLAWKYRPYASLYVKPSFHCPPPRRPACGYQSPAFAYRTVYLLFVTLRKGAIDHGY